MRSKAHVGGDPIHAALVHFPVAFLLGATAMDLIDLVFECPPWWTATSYVLIAAGILSALAAAVPGFIDFRYTVPPASSAKRRATRHMIVNLTSVVLFAGAWMLRGHAEIRPEPVLVGAEALAAILLGYGGMLGGKLVSKNQIGVDTKYAAQGRWSEVTIQNSGDVVATTDELLVDQMKLVRIKGQRIVLARAESGYVAFDDRCPHKGGSLAGGVMICGTVQCPWHGSQFSVTTGVPECGPAEKKIETYRVDESDDGIRVFLNS